MWNTIGWLSLVCAVFIGMLIWVCRMKKAFAQSMSALPLQDGEIKSNRKGTSHE